MTEVIFKQMVQVFWLYTKNNKKLDTDFLKFMYDKYNETEISKYISRVIILDTMNKPNYNNIDKVIRDNPNNYETLMGLAVYNSITNEIYLRNNRIERSINILKNYVCIKKKDEILFNNLFMLQVLLHEIEHANQMYEIEHESCLEADLLRLSNFYVSDSYEYSLKERLAEVKSIKYVLMLMDELKISSNEIYGFFENSLVRVLQTGYEFQDAEGNVTNEDIDIFTSPMEKYFIKGSEPLERVYRITDKIDDENIKLLYGLPLTYDEFQDIFRNSKKTRQKMKNKR